MPPVNPTLGPESPLCLPLFSVASNTKSISQEQRTKLVSHSKPNNIVLLPLAGEWIAGSCWYPEAIKHLPPPQKKALRATLTFGHYAAPPQAVWGARRCICWHPCIPAKERWEKPKVNNGVSVQHFHWIQVNWKHGQTLKEQFTQKCENSVTIYFHWTFLELCSKTVATKQL